MMRHGNKNSSGIAQPSSLPGSSLIALPLESLPTDLPLPFPVYLSVAGKFVLFRGMGDSITVERLRALREHQVLLGYVPELDWLNFLNSLETPLKGVALVMHGKGASDDEKNLASVTRLRHLILAYSQEMERRRIFQSDHLKRLSELGNQLGNAISKDLSLGAKLLRRYSDTDLYFVNHNVNVAIYCAAVANKLGLATSEVASITFAALVHNIGNLFVPKEVLYKPTALSRSEWELVCTHPVQGSRLLESLAAPKPVVLVARQHHERVDGLGYPEHKSNDEIHLFSKIVSIADVFDALTSQSPYRQPLSASEAIEKMLAMGGKFDPAILKMLGSLK